MKFEWDEEKNRLNIKKHNVSFHEAQTIFEDSNIQFYEDITHSDIEERFIAIGRSYKRNILFVCYCIRLENTIRLISAREANKKEREVYNAKHN